jgi:hypothetical protein
MRRSLDSGRDIIVCLEGKKGMRLSAAILVLVGLSLPCQALTVKELADIFEAQETAIVDVVVEYEWYNEKPLMPRAGTLTPVSREACVFATARPFSDQQSYSSKVDLVMGDGNVFSTETSYAYNGDVFKRLTATSVERSPQGLITKRADMLQNWTATPMAFTILRNRKEAMLSEVLRDHPEAVRLVEGTKRVREFNTIELDFVMPDGAVHRKYFFSVDHGYAPVRYEWIDPRKGTTQAAVDVLALEEAAPGLWFPVKGITGHVEEETANVYEAKAVKVNQNLAKDYFDLAFPPSTEIRNELSYLQRIGLKGSPSRLAILAIIPVLAIVGILLFRKLG